jgi:fermentation-respiration switch protein FrsA (DUF1100 family)
MLATMAIALMLGVLALLALVWWSQERIVFQPPAAASVPGARDGRIDYEAADGQQLFGLMVGEPRSAPGLLIAFHGNADIAVRQLPWAREVHARTGWAVLVAEYRGYGGLTGRPTAAAVQLDARAAYDAGAGMFAAPAPRVALYAHSLGTPVAVELAAELAAEDVRLHALLLESPFTSAREMAGSIGPHGTLLYRIGLVRFRWDTEAQVRQLHVPVAVVHGRHDNIVPVAMGSRVHAAAAVPGPLLIVDTAGHNDVAWQAGEDYWHWLRRALDGTRGARSARDMVR